MKLVKLARTDFDAVVMLSALSDWQALGAKPSAAKLKAFWAENQWGDLAITLWAIVHNPSKLSKVGFESYHAEIDSCWKLLTLLAQADSGFHANQGGRVWVNPGSVMASIVVPYNGLVANEIVGEVNASRGLG